MQLRGAQSRIVGAIDVQPHHLLAQVPDLSHHTAEQGHDARFVAILCNISVQKGADLLESLGRALQPHAAHLMVWGTVDPAYMPPQDLVEVPGD